MRALCLRRRPEHAFLCRPRPVPLRAEFADEPGPDIGDRRDPASAGSTSWSARSSTPHSRVDAARVDRARRYQPAPSTIWTPVAWDTRTGRRGIPAPAFRGAVHDGGATRPDRLPGTCATASASSSRIASSLAEHLPAVDQHVLVAHGDARIPNRGWRHSDGLDGNDSHPQAPLRARAGLSRTSGRSMTAEFDAPAPQPAEQEGAQDVAVSPEPPIDSNWDTRQMSWDSRGQDPRDRHGSQRPSPRPRSRRRPPGSGPAWMVSNSTHAPRPATGGGIPGRGPFAVADDDPAGRHALRGQQAELGDADRPAGGMGRDGQPRLLVGARRRPERALLGGRQVPVAPDLADDAGPDAAVIDAVADVADDEVGDLVGRVASNQASSRNG